MNYLFVTGQPSCGKTTLIKNMMLDPVLKNLRMSGFITEEVLGEGGRRVGFDIVTLTGERAILARKGGAAGPKVGQYTVDVPAFEALALPILAAELDVDLYVIGPLKPILDGHGNETRDHSSLPDEIGRMELCSPRFRSAVDLLFQANKPIFGSVAAARYGRCVAYCEEIKARRDTATLNLKPSTREEVAAEVRAGLALLVAPGPAASPGPRSEQAPGERGRAGEGKRQHHGEEAEAEEGGGGGGGERGEEGGAAAGEEAAQPQGKAKSRRRGGRVQGGGWAA